jgi:hypothetical protein
MIRFTWMQFRVQALVALVGLAILAIVLTFTGPNLVHLYDTTVAHCSAHGDCSAATSALISNGDKLGIPCGLPEQSGSALSTPTQGLPE